MILQIGRRRKSIWGILSRNYRIKFKTKPIAGLGGVIHGGTDFHAIKLLHDNKQFYDLMRNFHANMFEKNFQNWNLFLALVVSIHPKSFRTCTSINHEVFKVSIKFYDRFHDEFMSVSLECFFNVLRDLISFVFQFLLILILLLFFMIFHLQKIYFSSEFFSQFSIFFVDFYFFHQSFCYI